MPDVRFELLLNLGHSLLSTWYPRDDQLDDLIEARRALTYFASKQHDQAYVVALIYRLFECELVPISWNSFATRVAMRYKVFPGMIFFFFIIGPFVIVCFVDLPSGSTSSPSAAELESIYERAWEKITTVRYYMCYCLCVFLT